MGDVVRIVVINKIAAENRGERGDRQHREKDADPDFESYASHRIPTSSQPSVVRLGLVVQESHRTGIMAEDEIRPAVVIEVGIGEATADAQLAEILAH